jgi:lysophospholipase L1-like esterase
MRAQAADVLPGQQIAVNRRWLPAMGAILKAINEDCKRHNCKFVMLRFPMFTSNGNSEEEQLIQKIAATENIPYLDVTDLFSKRNNPNAAKFFYLFHFSPDGHKAVADHVTPFLKQVMSR